VSQWSVYLQRLAGNGFLAVRSKGGQRAHIVQPVGQLYENDPQVRGHSHQHLAQVFSLLFAHRGTLLQLSREGKSQLGELTHAVHQPRHVRPEFVFYLLERDAAIFRNVMQQGGG